MRMSLNHRSVGARRSGSWNVPSDVERDVWRELEASPAFVAWSAAAESGDKYETGLSAVFVAAWED